MSLKVKKPGEGHRHPASEIVANAVTREETVRLNANVPKSLYRQVRLHAVMHDTTITSLVLEALNEYLSKYSDK